ncbi:MAG: class I SAM-dependent methyltransferase [Planctomycetota bacterium]
MNDSILTLENYFRLMSANGADQVYRTALSSGLLDALRENKCSAAELANRLTAQEYPVALMCEVLESLGVIEQEQSRWALTPLAESLLSGPYRGLGDPYWNHLPEFLKTGEPMASMDDAAESEMSYQGQAAALGWMLAPAAAWTAAYLAGDFDHDANCDILDVGAGSAIWSLSFAARVPIARVTAADWPAVLEVAQATAQRMGLADRLTMIPGDLATASFPESDYDVVVLANVAHLLPPEALGLMVKRLAATLRPGGRLVIADVFPGLADGDLNRTLYTLGLALRTRAGQTHHADDVIDLMHTAGLVDGRFTPVDVVPRTMGLVIATRPQ